MPMFPETQPKDYFFVTYALIFEKEQTCQSQKIRPGAKTNSEVMSI